jgi:hypothetical protein
VSGGPADEAGHHDVAFVSLIMRHADLASSNVAVHLTAMFLLLCAISIIDTETPFAAWMERVPCPSNPADLPSRQKAGELCKLLDARDCGSIELPAGLLTFLMQSRFDSQLAEVVRFEAEVD